MDPILYFESLSMEISGLRDRVRHFIDDAHWLTDGEWKESVLRHFLRRSLPRSVEVGRGFVVSSDGVSKQLDVLIFDATKPVLFRDGDLVFVTPDAALGVIEVKTRLDNSSYGKCLERVSENLEFFGRHSRYRKFFGIFAYESEVDSSVALCGLQSLAKGNSNRTVDLVCLGKDHFIRWWYLDPINKKRPVKKWHSYRFDRLAFGYFIHNCIEFSEPQSVNENDQVWYPVDGKENSRDAEVGLDGDVVQTLPAGRGGGDGASPNGFAPTVLI